ncbi:MAG: PEP-CTERM sorting domain-containing protein [Planctomycetota bacterium]
MIFLNSGGNDLLRHSGVVWTFDGVILGVMSDSGGNLEAASTFELGAPGTNYTVIFGGSGPAAPFSARGMEGNNGTGLGNADGYQLLAPNQLRVGMHVTEPGDWIRVVTMDPVPEPGTIVLVAGGAACILWRRRRRARA